MAYTQVQICDYLELPNAITLSLVTCIADGFLDELSATR